MAISIGIGNYIRSSLYRGTKKNPFHPSLVDYWNFAGKKNSDTDRAIIKGIKGNILNAYNFGWSLGSGYGLYKNDFTKWTSQFGSINTKTTSYFDIDNINSPVKSNVWLDLRKPTDGSTYIHPSFKIRISGLNGSFATLKYREDGVDKNIQMGDGIHVIPSASEDRFPNTDKLDIYEFILPLDRHIRIEEIPLYEGAIVTDGIDDYLKLDKVGYKIGTVILKYTTLFRDNNWRYVFDVTEERCYFASNKNSGFFVTSMQYKSVGDYTYLIPRTGNNPTVSNTPLYISSHAAMKEFMSMALYEIAIYQDVLTAEEIQKEINVMKYGTPNPVFALNFDNFAYKAVDYPEFATGKVTTNKIVIDSTTTQMNGFIMAAYNPELTTGDAIELPSYKVKVTGIDAYGNIGDDYWAIALMGMPIDSSQEPWFYLIYKDGVYNIPAISLSDRVFNLSVMCQITGVNKPIEIEVLYDSSITTNFPSVKQIFP